MPAPSIWIKAFEDFIVDLRISSKEEVSVDQRGTKLNLWQSQRRTLDFIGRGLDDGVRQFYILKSRQLGLTTISLAIDLFWLAANKNMFGALVTDNEKNRDGNRSILKRYVNSFPEGYFGTDFYITKDNRSFMEFSNGSRIDFLVAGTKKKSVSWAEGAGYVMAHVTELAKFGDADGIESFMEAMPQTNPNRLFIAESTANGFNAWRTMWLGAANDPYTKRALFVGWWSGDKNQIPRSDPRFLQYGASGASGEEREKIGQVAYLYGHKITPEQLAWIRWRNDNVGEADGIFAQNNPWTAEDAFVMSGYSFFQTRQIAKDIKEIMDTEPAPVEEGGYGYTAYRYELTESFFDIKLVPCEEDDGQEIELKIWEEPVADGKYVIGMDPAWGRNDHKDRHSAQVYRCFADKIVQVAEYATANVELKHAAWVLAHLAGAYSDCIVNIDLNGPGRALMMEWDHVKDLLNAEMNKSLVQTRDWENALANARWYLYNRPDTMGKGFAANFECLALDTPLPTPVGWTTMGGVQVGDELLSDTGAPTTVIGVSDIKEGAKCYEIEFDDGTKIVADENHWWRVARRHWRGGAEKLRQTKQLEAGKFYIKPARPLDLSDAELEVDPYLLGVWLGDGTAVAAVVTVGDRDVEEMVQNIEAVGQPTRRTWARTAWSVRLNNGNNGSRGNPLLHKFRKLGVLNNKHIPAVYLRGSKSQRLALLQGLMDTDGGAGGNGGRQCNFVTTSPAIAAGFCELIRSLGLKAKYLTWDESPKKGVNCALRYQFWFTPYFDDRIFRLARKQARVDQSVRVPNRQCHRIVSIREVESVPVRCVMVDGPTSMYLAGDGMIPTHNTSWRNKSELMHQMRGSYVTRELVIRSIPLLDEMRIVVVDGSEIGAPESSGENSKDDRVFATALAVRAWINWRRPALMNEGLTYAVVMDQEQGRATPQNRALNQIVSRFFMTAEERAQMAGTETNWRVDMGLE